MQTKHNHNLLLDTHRFREIMRESAELIKTSHNSKYNLMGDIRNLYLYEFWAPYIVSDFPSTMVNSPGFKLCILQLMSVVLVLKDTKNNKDRYIAPDYEESEKNHNNLNIINFMAYANNKKLNY